MEPDSSVKLFPLFGIPYKKCMKTTGNKYNITTYNSTQQSKYVEILNNYLKINIFLQLTKHKTKKCKQ